MTDAAPPARPAPSPWRFLRLLRVVAVRRLQPRRVARRLAAPRHGLPGRDDLRRLGATFCAPWGVEGVMEARGRQTRTRQEFDHFVTGSVDGLLRAAYLIAWDFAEAEDLVQECLFRIARRWPRCPPDGAPRRLCRARCSSTWPSTKVGNARATGPSWAGRAPTPATTTTTTTTPPRPGARVGRGQHGPDRGRWRSWRPDSGRRWCCATSKICPRRRWPMSWVARSAPSRAPPRAPPAPLGDRRASRRHPRATASRPPKRQNPRPGRSSHRRQEDPRPQPQSPRNGGSHEEDRLRG